MTVNPNRTAPLVRARFVAALLAAAMPASGRAADATAWESRQTVFVTEAGPLRLALPPELLDAARADLGDVRLLSPDGGEVPFVVLRDDPRARPQSRTLAIAPRLDGRSTAIEVALAEPAPVTRLHLVTPAASFVKGMTVERRDEAGAWERIVEDAVVFRLPGRTENLALGFDGAMAAAFRVTIDDAREPPVPFTHVVLDIAPAAAEPPTSLPALVTAMDNAAEETRLTLDLGLRHRPIAGFTLEAGDPVFERSVRLIARTVVDEEVTEETLATGTIRRLDLPGGRSFADLTIPAELVTPSARLELAIDNGDAPPLSVAGVAVAVRPVHIAFRAHAAGEYTLLAGNPGAPAPRYDVATFAADWARLPLSRPNLAPLVQNPAYRPAQPSPEIPELAGPFDPKGWTRSRMVRIETPGAQVLELDAAVLAAARDDLADLRLVRDGRQVPYLLERTSRQHVLPLSIAENPDPERPRVGRWTIDLPIRGMPVSQLRFTVDEALFDRQATILEMTEDSRGQRRSRPMGQARWVRRSGSEPGRFSVGLQGRPESRQLVLEIDHGDNRPFVPVAVEAAYPLRRLRFVAAMPGEVMLHFGNPRAGAPRYDIDLAGPRLLAAPENAAVLAPPGEVEAALEGGGFSLGRGATRYIFWGALALAVVVLIWLVAKLLPKPPAGG